MPKGANNRQPDTLLSSFDPGAHIAEASMPPADWYCSDDFAMLEKRQVFSKSWHAVARLEELANPGDVRVGCSLGRPWLISRDSSGKIAAFDNVCRHKGMLISQQSLMGADELVCPYHGWKYDLDGRLRSAPKIAGIKNFDRDDMGLRQIRCESWGPWLFINFSEDEPSLIESVPELDRRLEDSQWKQLIFAGEDRWQLECNWKVAVDNYLDGGYHIPHMHPSLDDQLDMKSYRTEVFPSYSIQSSAGGDTQKQRIGGQALYAWLFPNFMINRYGPCMDANWVLPISPTRCEVHYQFFFDADHIADVAFIEQSKAQAAVTQKEDIAICESVQQGLNSGRYLPGRYAPRVEMGEFHFHQLLHEYLGRGQKGERARGPLVTSC